MAYPAVEFHVSSAARRGHKGVRRESEYSNHAVWSSSRHRGWRGRSVSAAVGFQESSGRDRTPRSEEDVASSIITVGALAEEANTHICNAVAEILSIYL